MSIGKKFAHKAEAVKGSIKLTAGRVKGNLKQAGAKVKDAARH
jgi:hypothetical protein